MNKRAIILLLVLALMLALCAGAAAADTQTDYVLDEAGLLHDSERTELTQQAERIARKYGVGVYIATLDDYRSVSSESVYTAAYTLYHKNRMGVGEGRDGIILLLSMNDRDFATFCYGERGEGAFSDYALEMLEDEFLDDFAENDWYDGFEDYVETCAEYLQKAAEGHPVQKSMTVPILIVIGASLLIALIVVAVMWASMKNVAEKTTANAYVSGGLQLTEQEDRFTHRTETRRKIERESSGSSSASGGGGHGRSGKF